MNWVSSPMAEFLLFKMSLYLANIYVSTHISWDISHPSLNVATSKMLPLAEEWRKGYCIAALLELFMHNYQSNSWVISKTSSIFIHPDHHTTIYVGFFFLMQLSM